MRGFYSRFSVSLVVSARVLVRDFAVVRRAVRMFSS